MEIEINKEIVIQKEITKLVEQLTIVSITDNYKSVEVIISLNDSKPLYLTLWEGEAYNNIGQWTDSDVEKRILELI